MPVPRPVTSSAGRPVSAAMRAAGGTASAMAASWMPADSSWPSAPRGLVSRSDKAAASAAADTDTGCTCRSRHVMALPMDEQQLVEDEELHDPQHSEAEQGGEVDEQAVSQPAEVVAVGVVLGQHDQPRRIGQADEGQRPEGEHLFPEVALAGLAPR